MITESTNQTSTSLAQPDTSRETRIGYSKSDSSGNWTSRHANRYWPADYLYLRKGEYYKHLDEIDGGYKNGTLWWNQPYFTFLANRDLIDILAGNLNLTKDQKRHAIDYFLDQDLQLWGIRKELVAWSICAYIVHSDKVDSRRCHPLTNEDDYDDLFLEAAYSLDLLHKDRVKTYNKIQNDLRLNWNDGGGI